MIRPDSTHIDCDCNLVFRGLAAERPRLILSLLGERSEPVTETDLAADLAATGDRSPDVDDPGAQYRLDLHHVQLPKLDEADLIDWDRDDGTVRRTDHPAFGDPGIRRSIADAAESGADPWRSLFGALANARNRRILDVLSHQYQRISIETLARDVAAKGADVPAREVSADTVDRLTSAFHHVNLQRLADAGLVEYDADEGTVAYAGHPELRVAWMHSEIGADFRARLADGGDDGVRKLQGRETVVSYGQSLCESADEELFMLFTASDLLEAGCFTRIEQAADRGVDVYLGTCDPTVREFVRENAPEVTLWEPETNWVDLPVEGDRLGRLVFADREALMVGTLGAETDEGVHEERAMAGEGPDETFVVLVRQLLSTKFERFEGDEADDATQIPS